MNQTERPATVPPRFRDVVVFAFVVTPVVVFVVLGACGFFEAVP